MRVSRKMKELISGFGSSWSSRYSGWSNAFSLPPVSVYRYTFRGRLATASERIRTQEYTAVICMEVRSFTCLPEAEPPMKKL